MQTRKRYIKRNIIDYLLIAAAILLILSLLARGVGLLLAENGDEQLAEIEFVIRSLDKKTAQALVDRQKPFFLSDGTAFAETYRAAVRPMTVIVEGPDGNLQEEQSLTQFQATFACTVTGRVAKDGTFLFAGVRRLAMGETLELTRGDATYRAEVVRVAVQAVA